MHPLQQPENPRRKAGLLSQLLFIWVIPILKKGFRRPLEVGDAYRVLPGDQSRYLGDLLEKAWNDEVARVNSKKRKQGDRPSLTRAITKVFGAPFMSLGIYACYEECILKILSPICLGLLLRYFKDPSGYPSYFGIVMALTVIILNILYTTSDHPYTFAAQHMGMQIRIALCSLLYRKGLRMSRRALEATTAGQIVNFLSSDMNRFDILLTFMHYIWVAPLQFFIAIAVMYIYLDIGWPCLTGIGLIAIFVPFQGLMGRVFGHLRQQTADRTDRRLILMEELLSSIRVIKMYAWEKAFLHDISESRNGEIVALRKTAYWKGVNQSMYYVASRIALFSMLLAFVLTNRTLTSEMVFVSLSLYNGIQTVLTLFFPAAVVSIAETRVAIKRFEDFMLVDEKPFIKSETDEYFFEAGDKKGGDAGSGKSRRTRATTATQEDFESVDSGDDEDSIVSRSRETYVVIRNARAQWDTTSRDFAFMDCDLEVRQGEVVAVIGPVGAGKGSLLQAIMGELSLHSGELRVNGTIAYASQEPWIFPGSVRDNIIFGKNFDGCWYEEVVYACALSRDLTLLPYGDHTLVGDRGVTLSGGQKARINLARAVYSKRDIYLLDAPLAAVDPEVGHHLMTHCILGLLRKKVVILVTHQLQYLNVMDKILLLVDGRPKFYGNYNSLKSSGIPFADLLTKVNQPGENSISVPTPASKIEKSPNISHRPSQHASSSTLIVGSSRKNPLLSTTYTSVYDEKKHPPNQLAKRVSTTCTQSTLARKQLPCTEKNIKDEEDVPQEQDEEMAEGDIGCSVYWSYISAGSTCLALIILFLAAILTQALFTCTDLWLQFWIEAEEKSHNQATAEFSEDPIIRTIEKDRSLQIYIYSGLITLLFAFALLRSLNFYRICIQSSVDLHQRLLTCIIRSPIRFFDENSIGRILNRFAKDMGVIDESLPTVAFDTLEIFLQTVGVVAVVSVSSPYMLIPAVIMCFTFYLIRTFYYRTGRTLKRLEGVARSPVFAHLSTTLYGLPTIRAFGMQDMLQTQFENCLDIHSSVWYLLLATTRWLGIVVDWISNAFVAAVIANCMISNLDDAVAGLAITSAMMLTSMLQWGIRQSADLAMQMVSVERVLQYCNIEEEAAWESDPTNAPPKSWPETGDILFQNVSLRYNTGSPIAVLKNINCVIYGGEKIGIVGRTGAGKSTLLAVLFRMAEPTEGFIEIDGVMTSNIGLHDLRSRISIIPQEPVLFTGSIRKNLDPFHRYPDEDIWNSLENSNLQEAVEEMQMGIHAQIIDGGSNFSQGQKQLFCLARAILRRNQILVLDEATANVDPETDALIQTTIKTKFAECTVLTIAHRLHTVMDSDRILVLDAGKILEFEEPIVLLNNQKSSLYQMAQQTGPSQLAALYQIAKEASEARRRGAL